MNKLLVLLVTLNVVLSARAPSAEVLVPKEWLIRLVEQGHKALVNGYLKQNMTKVYAYDKKSFDESLLTVSLNSTSQQATVFYNQSMVLYTYFGSSYKGYDYVQGFRLVLGFNHTAPIKLQCLEATFDYLGSKNKAISSYGKQAIAEIKDSFNSIFQTLVGQPLMRDYREYDLGYLLQLDQAPRMVNEGVRMGLSGALLHKYSKVEQVDLEQALQQQQGTPSFNASTKASLQLSSAFLQGYLSSAFHDQAFNSTVTSAAFGAWNKWLNLPLANIDVGFLLSFMPEVQTDLPHSQLLDVRVQALDVPSLAISSGEAQVTIQCNLQFQVAQVVLAEVTLDGQLSLKFAFNPKTTSLDVSDIDFQVNQVLFINDQQQLVHQGAGFAINAIAQTFQPALIKMINLKGFNVNNFFNMDKYVKTSIKNIVLEHQNVIVEMTEPDFSKFSFTNLYKSMKK